MVWGACIDCGCYGGDFPCAATRSCESENMAYWPRLSAARRCRAFRCCLGAAEAKRAQSILCILRLPDRYADERSVRSVSLGSASTESGLLPDHLEYQGQRIWLENRPDLVGRWDDSRSRVLRPRVPLIRRKSGHRQGLPRLRQLRKENPMHQISEVGFCREAAATA